MGNRATHRVNKVRGIREVGLFCDKGGVVWEDDIKDARLLLRRGREDTRVILETRPHLGALMSVELARFRNGTGAAEQQVPMEMIRAFCIALVRSLESPDMCPRCLKHISVCFEQRL